MSEVLNTIVKEKKKIIKNKYIGKIYKIIWNSKTTSTTR